MPGTEKKGIFALLIAVLSIWISYLLDENAKIFIESVKNVHATIFFSSITNIAIVFLMMLFIPCYIIYKKSQDKKAINALVAAFIFSVLLSLLIKIVFFRERPDIMIKYPLISVLDYSFPSMHAMIVFSLLPILMKNLRLKWLWIILAFLISFSRIYLGFHYLSDVVFGAFAGLLVGHTAMHFFENGKTKKV